jgi:hypothetical protein
MEERNSFHQWMEQTEHDIGDIDHHEMQQRIHNRMGALRFVGHIADMYLQKMFRAAGMKVGGRYDTKPLESQSDQYGPAGPSQPKN